MRRSLVCRSAAESAAAESGHSRLTRLRVAGRPAREQDGKTACRWALEAGNAPAVTLLVFAGADPFAGSPPLPALPVPPDAAEAARSRLEHLRLALASAEGQASDANMPREGLALLRARRKRAAGPGAAGVGANEDAAALEQAAAAAEKAAREAAAVAERIVGRIAAP